MLNQIKNQALKDALKNKKLLQNIILEGENKENLLHTSKLLCLYLFCDKNGCLECKTCQNILNDNFDNIKIIERDKNKQQITIDKIIEIKRQASLPSINSKFTVFIIKDSEFLNPTCQNALLKTIEDYSPNVYFVFLVNNKYSLLDTVISRCACYYIDAPDIKNHSFDDIDYEKQDILNFISLNSNLPSEFFKNKKLYLLSKELVVLIMKNKIEDLMVRFFTLFKNYKKADILNSLNFIKTIINIYVKNYTTLSDEDFISAFFTKKTNDINKLILVYESIDKQIIDLGYNINSNILAIGFFINIKNILEG